MVGINNADLVEESYQVSVKAVGQFWKTPVIVQAKLWEYDSYGMQWLSYMATEYSGGLI